MFSEGCQHSARGSALVENVVPHKAYDGESLFHFQRIQFPGADFISKTSVGCFLGLFCVLFRHGYAHSVYRRSLGYEYDIYAIAAESFEEPAGESGDAHHSAAFKGEQGNVVGIGNADELVFAAGRILLDEGTGIFRMECVLDINRYANCNCRPDCRWINHFCSKMGQFKGGLVGDVPDGSC